MERVVTTTSDSGPGSLRDVIGSYAAGDTISFAPGLSGQTIKLTSGHITLNTSLALDASTLPAGLAIDGNANGRIFSVSTNTTVLLDSLTITNGNTTNGGGGGIINQGTLTLNRCSVAGNMASADGGGILNSGSLIVTQGTISGNSASSGGGIGNENLFASLVASQSTFSGNSANAGGGLYVANGSGATVNQCTFSGNHAGSGGGIFDAGGTSLSHCTLASNYATNQGGGIYKPYAGGLTLFNSIAADNTAGNPGAWGPNISIDIITYPTHEPVYLGTNITTGNPLLAPLGNYGGPTQTMPPLAGSPAIDACTNGTAYATDQRGFPRPVDGNGDSIAVADIGAVEGFVYYGPGTLTGTKKLGNGALQFGFPNNTNQSFTVFATTNFADPLNTWSNLGPAVETPPGSGQYQFTDPGAMNNPQRFYRVRSP